MAYRVIYGPMPKVSGRGSCDSFRLRALTAACLLVFSMGVRQFWPEGRDRLRQVLLPGEETLTEAAFQDMMGDIRAGETLGDALTAFCREIVENGIPEVS